MAIVCALSFYLCHHRFALTFWAILVPLTAEPPSFPVSECCGLCALIYFIWKLLWVSGNNENCVKGVCQNDLMSFLYVQPFAGVKISVSGDSFAKKAQSIFYAAHGIMIKGI